MTSLGWKCSYHGGHNAIACDHAGATLEQIVHAAQLFGYHSFGFTEHAPRVEPHRMYAEERALGWDVDELLRRFRAYSDAADALRASAPEDLTILKGFEAEVVPEHNYPEIMLAWRREMEFDYLVGSVHWVGGHIIDYTPAMRARAIEACGGLEAMARRYYQTAAQMLHALRPEIVGHFDLVRLAFDSEEAAAAPAIRNAAMEALEAARDVGALIDVNTAGYRKGLGRPYPAPWIVRAALDLGLGFTLGDDSHEQHQVGMGIHAARRYLLDLGCSRVIRLTPSGKGLDRQPVSLEQA